MYTIREPLKGRMLRRWCFQKKCGDTLLLCIDESGSINNRENAPSPFFVVAIVHMIDPKAVQRAYKRFVSANLEQFRELDRDKTDSSGKVVRYGGKMFANGSFKELKGSLFDKEMKCRFLSFFSEKPSLEVFLIKVRNDQLYDSACRNTARFFNFLIDRDFQHLIRSGYLQDSECVLLIDERNERTDTKFFLQEYLNTDLTICEGQNRSFTVQYQDSARNPLIQIADVFANWYYSYLKTGDYRAEMAELQKIKMIKDIFEFPMEY